MNWSFCLVGDTDRTVMIDCEPGGVARLTCGDGTAVLQIMTPASVDAGLYIPAQSAQVVIGESAIRQLIEGLSYALRNV